jgi:hypothetical protein
VLIAAFCMAFDARRTDMGLANVFLDLANSHGGCENGVGAEGQTSQPSNETLERGRAAHT